MTTQTSFLFRFPDTKELVDYTEFLKTKKLSIIPSGFEVNDINPLLFDFQSDIVKWSLKKGKAAIFAGTGLGKTLMQLEWAHKVCKHTNKNVLILAPLAVAQQTVREGHKLDIEVTLCRTQSDVNHGINITNYEMMQHFDESQFIGIVLDESSILKSFDSKTKAEILIKFRNCAYKLACTATPAPNDYMELGNHAEFLSIMSRTEMLSTFFVHDMAHTQDWRLKKHAVKDFWEWVSSWAIMLRNPIDLGYDNNKFDLPELRIHEIVVDKTGYVVREAQTLQERRGARRDSLNLRVSCAAEIANKDNEPCLVWCNLNTESVELSKMIDNAIEVTGSQNNELKSELMLKFSNGELKTLVSKPSICGFGMNWQHCHKMIFVGLSDSFEQYYQAVRRCWRFGQDKPVDVYIITSEKEGAVVKNIKRKEKDFEDMLRGMVSVTSELMKENIKKTHNITEIYKKESDHTDLWKLVMGDNIESIKEVSSDSIGYIIYSPPFSSLYTYSNSARDMGNCRNDEEFYNHFKFLISELFRVLMPGRLMSVHCMNLPTSKERDGVIGIKDFRGDLIRMFQAEGFTFHSEVVVWKDPVTAMQRTKALGLLHKQIKKDSCRSRQGIPDYVITFRKTAINPEPVTHTNESFPVDLWQKYASPVWMDINQSDTLQRESAREFEDERHIAPLQLEVIRRCLELWTNPNDLVLDPFAGIGSTGFEAIKSGRRFIGFELKESYYRQAVGNLKAAERELSKPKQTALFSESFETEATT